jgi:tRNA A-37 threonylcarbamoyl transferase component Bud32
MLESVLYGMLSAHARACAWRSVSQEPSSSKMHWQAVIHRDLKPANLMIGGGKIYNAYHKHLTVVGV